MNARLGECESQVWTIYVYICEMWLTDNIVINDINWYEVTLMFMIMLIEYDVVIEEDIDNNWYEMILLLMILIDMRWHWCLW